MCVQHCRMALFCLYLCLFYFYFFVCLFVCLFLFFVWEVVLTLPWSFVYIYFHVNLGFPKELLFFTFSSCIISQELFILLSQDQFPSHSAHQFFFLFLNFLQKLQLLALAKIIELPRLYSIDLTLHIYVIFVWFLNYSLLAPISLPHFNSFFASVLFSSRSSSSLELVWYLFRVALFIFIHCWRMSTRRQLYMHILLQFF